MPPQSMSVSKLFIVPSAQVTADSCGRHSVAPPPAGTPQCADWQSMDVAHVYPIPHEKGKSKPLQELQCTTVKPVSISAKCLHKKIGVCSTHPQSTPLSLPSINPLVMEKHVPQAALAGR